MFLNVLVLAIWMLVRGVDRDKWDRAVAGETRSLGLTSATS
jgi:hypothetical protein